MAHEEGRPLSTRRLARRAFALLALLVALMAGWHVQLGVSLAREGGASWPHFLLATLYLVGALGLMLRPRGFVVYFGLLTIYAVTATLVGAWRAVRGPVPFQPELAVGFILFPLALNLLLADELHERTEETSRPRLR